MFTGLVQKISKVEKITLTDDGAKICFVSDFDNVKTGDSIAINGVCLTITSIEKGYFQADIMKETLNKTNLKILKKGDEINLELAMKITDRLDGHIVSGHIDSTAVVKSIISDGFSKKISFKCENELIVNKGSIAINGVSLTVSKLEETGFEISLIPETLNKTNLKNLKIGDTVNVEFDLIGKYIHKFISKSEKNIQKSNITEEFLKENGF